MPSLEASTQRLITFHFSTPHQHTSCHSSTSILRIPSHFSRHSISRRYSATRQLGSLHTSAAFRVKSPRFSCPFRNGSPLATAHHTSRHHSVTCQSIPRVHANPLQGQSILGFSSSQLSLSCRLTPSLGNTAFHVVSFHFSVSAQYIAAHNSTPHQDKQNQYSSSPQCEPNHLSMST